MNKDLILQDIDFPISWDTDEYKMYLFDADMNMIAQVEYSVLDARENYHPFEKLIGGYKEVESIGNRYSLTHGDFYDTQGPSEPIGCVRGWGRLQKLEGGEDRQDNIAEYMLNVMNS